MLFGLAWEGWLTGALIVTMVSLLVSGRFGADIVMLGVVVALLLFGIITPASAVAGFSNTGVITVALLYVVATGLKETGAMTILTSRLLGRPKGVREAQLRLMLPAAGLSAFVNNTPIVAMFLPVLSDWGKRHRLAASMLFMPLSFAAILGGICTLIGTSTNLVIKGLIDEQNRINRDTPGWDTLETLGMFTMTPVGVVVMVFGIGYMLLMGKWMLPKREPVLPTLEGSRQFTTEMRVEPGSPVVGKSVEQAGLRHLPGLYLSRIERDNETVIAVEPEETLGAGDILVFVGVLDSVVDLQKIKGLSPVAPVLEGVRQHHRLIEAVVSPSSPLVGRSVRAGQLRTHYGAVVIAVSRHGERVRGKIGDIVLRPGDTLLLEAPVGWARKHRDSSAFYLVSEMEEAAAPRHERAWIALGILVTLVGLITFEVLDTMTAAMGAAGTMVLLRCCTGPQARRSVDWQVLIVIAAAFGIGTAMSSTGLAAWIAHGALGWTQAYGPLVMLAMIYLTTVLFTSLITNNAAAVLVFPIALELTRSAGVTDFTPYAICIAIAASAEFMTPIGYQTNLMVMGPGGYKWMDYTKFGAPLMVLCGIICVLMAHTLSVMGYWGG